ncbi:MAG TPA: GNAT family N-acetyltransferase, partial [Bacteroidales bacterium]|nr:GNAT family N-acetyltransferase [Bacteroidales bacterium]
RLGYKLDDEYFDIQSVYGYTGIISNSYEDEFIQDFYLNFNKYCLDNHIIAEFIRFHPLLNNYNIPLKTHTILLDRKTVGLNICQSYEDIWKHAYSSTNRNMIRKAQKIGYSAIIMHEPSMQDIEQFMEIYHQSMRAVHADSYYFFNRNYFLNMFQLLKKHIYLIQIKDCQGKIVCASVFFHYYNFFHYHLSGRIQEADNSVNNFLLDEAVKLAQNLGAAIFHFGGGRTASPNDSLLKFKKNFSKTTFDFYIGKKIYNQEVYNMIMEQWKTNHPLSYQKHAMKLLGYREI